MLVTLIVPMYNEEARLPAVLPHLAALARRPNTELLLVDDGSSDCTANLVATYFIDRESVRVLQEPHRGKGGAVRAGVAAARGDVMVFMDADLSTDIEALPRLIGALEHADMAIGSRAVEGSIVAEAAASRVLMGRAFNQLVRAASGVRFRDTQCGFKAFRSSAAKILFDASVLDSFAFDVEIIALAQRLGLTVVELPIRWHGVAGSHVRPVIDSLLMARDVLRANVRERVKRMEVVTVRVAASPPGAVIRVADHVRGSDIVQARPDSVVTWLCGATPADGEVVSGRLRTLFPDVEVTSELMPALQLVGGPHAPATLARPLDFAW